MSCIIRDLFTQSSPFCLLSGHAVPHKTSPVILTLHCDTFHCATFHCDTFHCDTFHCDTLHCATFHCDTFQCDTFHCDTFHCDTFHYWPQSSTTGQGSVQWPECIRCPGTDNTSFDQVLLTRKGLIFQKTLFQEVVILVICTPKLEV